MNCMKKLQTKKDLECAVHFQLFHAKNIASDTSVYTNKTKNTKKKGIKIKKNKQNSFLFVHSTIPRQK